MDNNNTPQQHKSSWAYVVVLFVVIIFGLFWLIQSKAVTRAPLPLQPVPQKSSSLNQAADLEASVSAIEIPDYSEEF